VLLEEPFNIGQNKKWIQSDSITGAKRFYFSQGNKQDEGLEKANGLLANWPNSHYGISCRLC